MIAWADSAAQAAQPSALQKYGTMIPILLMIVIFYFLLIRPQQKKEKERKGMIDQLKEGDRVLTAGGMYATVSEVKDDTIVLKINSNTKVEFAKTAIQTKIQ
jgi:preprotein translocase subunit YajC